MYSSKLSLQQIDFNFQLFYEKNWQIAIEAYNFSLKESLVANGARIYQDKQFLIEYKLDVLF